MWSFRKWCLTYMCFVRECCIGLLDRCIVLVLSHLKGTWLNASPKSSKVCFMYKIWAQKLLVAKYFGLVVDRAIEFYYLLAQNVNDDSKK
jgi:hypothetical protein